MKPQPYESLSDIALVALAVWREARGESQDGKRGVAHVIANRVKRGGWWGSDWKSVILKPWQFSSFNANDPNSEKWPDEDASWTDSLSAASGVITGLDDDLTEGATYYHDTTMGWPKAWGNPADYVNTLNVGRLKFYRDIAHSNRVAVQRAAMEEDG